MNKINNQTIKSYKNSDLWPTDLANQELLGATVLLVGNADKSHDFKSTQTGVAVHIFTLLNVESVCAPRKSSEENYLTEFRATFRISQSRSGCCAEIKLNFCGEKNWAAADRKKTRLLCGWVARIKGRTDFIKIQILLLLCRHFKKLASKADLKCYRIQQLQFLEPKHYVKVCVCTM